MRKALMTTASVLGVAFSSLTQAATLIPVVPIAGSTVMSPFGINDANVLGGSYVGSDGIEHGFYGPLDGSNYTSFDLGRHEFGTEPRAIGNDGSMTGFAPGSRYVTGQEFFRNARGRIRPITGGPGKRKFLDGLPQGMDDKDVFVGDYTNSVGIRTGYYGKRFKFQQDFDLAIQGYQQNSPRAITSGGVVAGYFIDKDSGEHGFIVNNGTVSVIDFPGTGVADTVLEGINNSGIASGQWDDTGGGTHSFVLDSNTSTFTSIDTGDGATIQQAWGINSAGLVPISEGTASTVSYIYCPLPKKQCPSGGLPVKTRQTHVPAGTFLHYDRYGRTGRKLPAANSVARHGAMQ